MVGKHLILILYKIYRFLSNKIIFYKTALLSLFSKILLKKTKKNDKILEEVIFLEIVERFLNYVRIDTQSDPNSNTYPSTLKQLNLANLLVSELKELGLANASVDKYGYVTALLEGDKARHSVAFLAHMDTSFDMSGKNVKPQIIENYDGEDVKLNENLTMYIKDFPHLSEYRGHDMIFTDGTTLLGADDKAGIAIIMDAISKLINDKNHGDIYIAFTPDEEVGEGVTYFNLENFKADFAYTLDGDKAGGIEYENFNAASCIINVTGKSIHPGSAKGKMVNALKQLFRFDQMLPLHMVPEATEGYEGFNHLTDLSGSVEKATAHYIIRNHDIELFNKQKEDFQRIAQYLNAELGYEAFQVEIKDSYYNMASIINENYEIIEIAQEATKLAGLTPFSKPIRGGTDGARLTFMGLPTPNLGTGGGNFHGKYEYLSINEMKKASEIVVNIAHLVK